MSIASAMYMYLYICTSSANARLITAALDWSVVEDVIGERVRRLGFRAANVVCFSMQIPTSGCFISVVVLSCSKDVYRRYNNVKIFCFTFGAYPVLP